VRIGAALLLLAAVAGPAGAEEIAVRVTLDGRPAPGAEVAALAPDRALVFDRSAWRPDATTDAEGIAVVPLPPGGRVLVLGDNRALAVAQPEGRTTDVELRAAWPFRGRVEDAAGEPVAGAAVYLRTKHRPATFRTTTDETGAFAFSALWLDDYRLRVEAAGYLPEERGPLTDAASGRVYSLARPAALVATVKDAEGTPLAGWPLVAGGARTRTDAEGRARLGGLRPGEVRLAAEAPYQLAATAPVALGDGAVVAVEARGVAPATVRATLVSRADRPLEAIRVELNGRALERGADGSWTGRVRSGQDARIEAEAAGHLPATFQFLAPEAGRTLDLGELVLEPHPVGDVIVRAPDAAPPPSGRAVPLVGPPVPFEGGRVELPVGEWVFEVEGYPRVRAAVVSPGPVHVELPDPHFFEGRVLDAAGAPVEGAGITCAELEATTDDLGRFRIAPVADRRLTLAAHHGGARVALVLRPGPGAVELRLPRRELATLRGRVLAGGRPLRRFKVNDEPFLDPDGRFELVVDRARRRHVVVEPELRGPSYPFALPPPGEELVARIPGGAIHAGLEGGAAGTPIELRSPTGATLDTRKTGEDGVARFERISEGRYRLAAEGFEPADCVVSEGDPVVVQLIRAAPEPTGTVRIVWPGGREEVEELPEGPATLASGRGRVRVAAGEERVFDWTANPGELVIRGGAVLAFVERSWPAARLRWNVYARVETLTLGTGVYRIPLALRTRTVVIRAGERTVLEKATARHTLRGRVLDANGQPVPGARIDLRPEPSALFADVSAGAGGWEIPDQVTRHVRTDPSGGFAVDGVPPGRFDVRASRAGYVPAVSRVVVADDGIVRDGFPLVLRPSARARVRVLDPTGAPLPGVQLEAAAYRARTGPLGWAELPEETASISIAVPGFARMRDVEVRDGDVLRLSVSADLRVLGAPSPERMTLRIGGEAWAFEPEPLDSPGRFERADLPPGDAVLTVAPEPDSGDPARVFRFRLNPGERTTVDLDR